MICCVRLYCLARATNIFRANQYLVCAVIVILFLIQVPALLSSLFACQALCVVDGILSLLYVAGCAAHDFDPGYTSWPVEHYPGYQSFFSCATGIFGVGRRPTHLPP